MTTFSKYRAIIRKMVVEKFSPKLPPDGDNVRHNRALWNQYARAWDREIIDLEKDPKNRDENISVLGDEWGTPGDFEQVFDDFFVDNLSKDTDAVEIGVGGGRVARKVSPLVNTLKAFDISSAMLEKARAALAECDNVELIQLDEPVLPDTLNGCADFVYSFDVFVHLDLHMIFSYLRQMARVIKPDGRILIHTSNLAAANGWKRFAAQDKFKVSGHYFVCPELIRILVEKAGLAVVKESSEDPDNFYYGRDYICLLKKA